VHEAKRALLGIQEPVMKRARFVEQVERADEIGLDEFGGPLDRAVDMAFRGE